MQLLAVGIGGFLGAILRYEMGQWCAPWVAQSGFPWGTLLINLSGCLVLAFFLTITLEYYSVRPSIRVGLGTGFLGAFTTFSTFTLECVYLLNSRAFWSLGIYLMASIAGGTVLSALGVFWARNLERAQRRHHRSQGARTEGQPAQEE
ncbi:fluoride efflux transporter CrcB [Heliophilum fasciatum]|uniref:Fluoride-specific ion channel FluC n=1 Tax=Heliophilum fasciatum TaxID=35700 RepID=A0A4R2RZJ1_9FIRM|nr:fluoride efflux transporter CrcB [Heliophilum fasciatum]MCW2276665.1 CrcB protein [Heliophilum fasciatum]TCP68954.1 camphor resistance protein CrcB [Heliophilum fasciatum]